MKKIMFAAVALIAVSAQSAMAWEKCGNGGAVCENKGPAEARYGYPDNWATKKIKGDIDCNPEMFEDADVDGDPFGDGRLPADKYCEKQG